MAQDRALFGLRRTEVEGELRKRQHLHSRDLEAARADLQTERVRTADLRRLEALLRAEADRLERAEHALLSQLAGSSAALEQRRHAAEEALHQELQRQMDRLRSLMQQRDRLSEEGDRLKGAVIDLLAPFLPPRHSQPVPSMWNAPERQEERHG